jgi:hypothetical protein
MPLARWCTGAPRSPAQNGESDAASGEHEGRWQTARRDGQAPNGKAPSDTPALKPYWGKPAVRNFRGDDGNVGIIRSPVRAIVLPDYGEGPATHTGLESCGGDREGAVEALTEVRTGWVLSRVIHAPVRERRVLRGADAVEVGGRQDRTSRKREARTDPARSETPSTCGNTLHGNREIPRSPVAEGAAGRIGKSKDARR